MLLALPVAIFASWALLPLVAWDLASLIYMARVWTRIWRLDPTRTAGLATREDPSRAVTDLLILGAAVVSLVAVGFVLGRASSSKGSAQAALAGLAVGSVAISWAMVHTVHTLRYACLYYTGTPGGIDFNEHDPPTFSDFAYLSFTIGMTFQVSDTPLESRDVRRTALAHALLSFLFVTGIVATTINLVANLGH